MAPLRRALTELVMSAGGDATQPQELARQFGLDKSLAWKISKVVTESDPAVAAPLLPRASGLSIFIRSLRKAGAPPVSVEATERAIEDFNRMVEVHCGDRDTLEMMLGATAASAGRRLEAHRKLSFRGNSATWGVQARVQLAAQFAAPSEEPGLLDIAVVAGLIDFRRLRQEVPWSVAAMGAVTDDWAARNGGAVEAIDPAGLGPGGAPLMPEFCSRPLPTLRLGPAGPGLTRFELTEGPVGNTAALTCVTGWRHRHAVPIYRTESDRFGEHFCSLSTPVEVLIHDVFLHRDMAFAIPPTTAVYSRLPSGPVYPQSGRDKGRLPVEPAIDLGSAPPDVFVTDLPAYPEMVRRVMDRMGWRLDDFHGFRLRLRYPPIPALAVTRYELPERP